VARVASIERLMDALRRLPGVGPKTSERLAFHLLRVGEGEAIELADAIRAARAEIVVCRTCFNLDQRDPCGVCADAGRDPSVLLVVEDPRDVGHFEETGYRGRYHVLQGRISAADGITPDDLTIDALVRRLRADGAPGEVCLATNPDLEGEATANYLVERLRESGVELTRIARGLPAGASIGQVSRSILADAVEGRRKV